MAAQAPAAWTKFLHTLQDQGVAFEDIQHSDPKTRDELVGELTANFTKLEKAVISSHWNKLNTAAGLTHEASGANFTQSPSVTSPTAGGGGRPAGVPPLGNVPSSGSTPFGHTPRDATGQQQQQQSGAVQQVGGYLVSNDGVSYGPSAGPFDPAALRAALSRGDATTSLPLASEMLQKDPLALCGLLHEFAPHLSVATIKSILGLDGGPPGRGLPPAITATSDASPLRFGAMEGNDVASAAKRNAADGAGNSANSTIAMVNGTQVPVGQVLTSVGLSATYGPGFSITCNGQLVHLPYCVQPGDRITVTAAEVRI